MANTKLCCLLYSVWPKTQIPLKNQVLLAIYSLEDQPLAVSS